MADAAALASEPTARTCRVAPRGAFTRMTFTGLFASNQGPPDPNAMSTFETKLFASCVSLTEGRACNPT